MTEVFPVKSSDIISGVCVKQGKKRNRSYQTKYENPEVKPLIY